MATNDPQDDRDGRGRERDVGGEIEEVALDVASIVEAHPVGALATALGVGYVLGGGVFTRLTAHLVRIAVRLGVKLAVIPVIEGEIVALAGGLGSALKGDRDEGDPGDGTRH
jgi:hypothetical protein